MNTPPLPRPEPEHHPDLCPGCGYPRDTPAYLQCPGCGHIICECGECSLWLEARPVLKEAKWWADRFNGAPGCPGCKKVRLEDFIDAPRQAILDAGLPLRTW